MEIANTLFIFFKKPNMPTKGELTLSSSKIQTVLRNECKVTNDKIIVRDDSKVTWDKSVWDEFVKLGYVKNRQYVAEKFDCEDFTLVMSATAAEVLGNSMFGILDHDRPKLGDAHSINFFIDSSRKVWIYEPQDGSVMSYSAYKSLTGCVPRYFLL